MRRYEDATAPQAGHFCPACHQPVTEKITRHRTWGLFVPMWKRGPCHNPTCPEYVPSDRSEREELAALRRENRQLHEEVHTLKDKR
jgi:hypothetical protein